MERPELNEKLDKNTFLDYYYSKEELVAFCKKIGAPVVGGKLELTAAIARYLDKKEVDVANKTVRLKGKRIHDITLSSPIEENFVCSELHRKFFSEHIKNFTFNVPFQKWLKSNAGKTYSDAIVAYENIMKEKKNKKSEIGKQFEYNTYIRDFFADNSGKSLNDAIVCWNYKKSLPGSHRYEKSDLIALK